MEPRLLAAKVIKSTDEVVSLGERAAIDYQELAINIVLKFVDVLEGVAIIAVGFFLMRWVKRYFSKIEVNHERQRTGLNLLEKITSGFIITVSVTLGLKVIGLDLTLIVSVLTLGLSFGMRDVIKNYVAGLLTLFKSPFEIGDIVKIRNYTGRVERIDFQSITLRTFEHKEITIHNSDLLTQPITNFSKREQARMEIEINLGYGSDLELGLKIFDRIIQNHSLVLKSPRYSIVFREFSDTGTKILARFWVKRPCNALHIRSEIALQIQEAFDEEKLFAPFNREAGLSESFGFTETRKERLKAFYGLPMLTDIAGTTAQQIAAAVSVPAEDYADADEPE